VTGRQKAYFGIRGVAVVAFVMSWAVLPRGGLAAAVAIVAGLCGLFTCLGVNAGGPGERAGARTQSAHLERVRPPQGDWPPYEEDRIVDGELVTPPDRRAR
jgi:hypothetical protein